MIVRLFSTPTCPYCKTLKRFLEEKDIPFDVVDISEDLGAQNEVIEKTQQSTVPVIRIDEEYIVGFDRKKIVELLKIQD